MVPVTPSTTTVQAGTGDEFGVTFTFGGDDLGEMPAALFVEGEPWRTVDPMTEISTHVTNTVSTNFVAWEQLKPCADITLTYRVYEGQYFEETLGSDPDFSDLYVGGADVLFKGDPSFDGCDPTWGVGSVDENETITDENETITDETAAEEQAPALAQTGTDGAAPLAGVTLGASALMIGLALVARRKLGNRRSA